jgi:flagellar biosynthesis/type III secretory pathway protein FliH
MTNASTLRVPSFLAAIRPAPKAVTLFGGSARPEPPAAEDAAAAPAPAPAPPAPEPVPAPVVFPPVETPAAAMAALERQMAETASRVELAVERLRAVSERLAAEARADALELAMAVARRLVEAELTTGVEAQVAFIRNAVKRLGDARPVVVRLPPAQAAKMREHAAALGDGAAAVARIEVVADASLERGDCVVEGELGSVDGRLSPRLEEVRRAILAELGEEGGA